MMSGRITEQYDPVSTWIDAVAVVPGDVSDGPISITFPALPVIQYALLTFARLCGLTRVMSNPPLIVYAFPTYVPEGAYTSVSVPGEIMEKCWQPVRMYPAPQLSAAVAITAE